VNSPGGKCALGLTEGGVIRIERFFLFDTIYDMRMAVQSTRIRVTTFLAARCSREPMTDTKEQPITKEVLDFRLHLKRLEIIDTVVRLTIPWCGGILIALCAAYTVSVLAGKYTFAQIGISLLGSLKVSETISYAFGASGVIYGLKEGALRRKNIHRLSSQIQNLERQVNPTRSSSSLTTRGTTQPGDK
jgi:hypothetical protein